MPGYDLDAIRAVADAVTIPVIASGGAGTYEHMLEAVTDGGASAVAAASMFHFTEQTPLEAKQHLACPGHPCRDIVIRPGDDPARGEERLEALWAGDFGDEYVDRNADVHAPRGGVLAATRRAHRRRQRPRGGLQPGRQPGLDRRPASTRRAVFGVDVNRKALATLHERLPDVNAAVEPGSCSAVPRRFVRPRLHHGRAHPPA